MILGKPTGTNRKCEKRTHSLSARALQLSSKCSWMMVMSYFRDVSAPFELKWDQSCKLCWFKICPSLYPVLITHTLIPPSGHLVHLYHLVLLFIKVMTKPKTCLVSLTASFPVQCLRLLRMSLWPLMKPLWAVMSPYPRSPPRRRPQKPPRRRPRIPMATPWSPDRTLGKWSPHGLWDLLKHLDITDKMVFVCFIKKYIYI